jgi:hypothetical protein
MLLMLLYGSELPQPTGSSVDDPTVSTCDSKQITATLEHHSANPCHRMQVVEEDRTVEFLITSAGITGDVVMD